MPPCVQKKVARTPCSSKRSRMSCNTAGCAHSTSTVKQTVAESSPTTGPFWQKIAPTGKQRGSCHCSATQWRRQSEHHRGCGHCCRIGLDKTKGGKQSSLTNSPPSERNRQR